MVKHSKETQVEGTSQNPMTSTEDIMQSAITSTLTGNKMHIIRQSRILWNYVAEEKEII